MKKSRAQSVALSVAVILAVMCTAESCDQKKVKKAFREWNYKAGKAAVACNEAWDESYKAIAEETTKAIIAEHGDDPNFSDDMAMHEFEKRMAEIDKHNEKFEESMKIIKNSLEAIEQSLDASDHVDAKLWKAMIKDILNALDNVTVILNEVAIDSESVKFQSAVNWIGVAVNGANSILDALVGYDPDPDDPKDD